jgi:hypothetical protein
MVSPSRRGRYGKRIPRAARNISEARRSGRPRGSWQVGPDGKCRQAPSSPSLAELILRARVLCAFGMISFCLDLVRADQQRLIGVDGSGKLLHTLPASRGPCRCQLDSVFLSCPPSNGNILTGSRAASSFAKAHATARKPSDVADARIAEGIATAAGQAETARVLSPNGGEVLLCDVGGPDSDAVIKLTTTSINRGGPVRLTSFRLAMP